VNIIKLFELEKKCVSRDHIDKLYIQLTNPNSKGGLQLKNRKYVLETFNSFIPL